MRRVRTTTGCSGGDGGGGSDYDDDEDDEEDDGGNRPEPDAPSAGARGANLRLVRERTRLPRRVSQIDAFFVCGEESRGSVFP